MGVLTIEVYTYAKPLGVEVTCEVYYAKYLQ